MNQRIVKGVQVDEESRCAHYHSEVDVVALQFACCEVYYGCYQCHQELADHPPEKWGKNERDREAVLCGHCKNTMTIAAYLEVNECPSCDHAFNEGCSNHYPLYFEM